MAISTVPQYSGAGGTVTSVGLTTATPSRVTITGSPVTTSGNINIDVSGGGGAVLYGAFASLPATCATGDVYIVSDRRWTYVATGTNTWEARLNGVAIVPPAAAANWTFSNTANGTKADNFGGLAIGKGNQGGNMFLRNNTAAPATPWTVEIGFEATNKSTATNATFGLTLFQTSGASISESLVMDYSPTSGDGGVAAYLNWTNTWTFNADYGSENKYNGSPSGLWQRIVNDGATITGYVSRNGVDWSRVSSHASAAYLPSVGFFGFMAANENGVSSATLNVDRYSVFHFKVS